MKVFDFEVEELSLIKNKKRILNHINCQIPSGKLSVLIGPNGAGKSSLLRCLTGLENFQSGNLLLEGKSLDQYSQSARTKILSWCPAETRMPFSYSCLEVVCMGRFPSHSGYPKDRDYEIAKEAMKQVGLEDLCNSNTRSLSSGEFRKLMIARALASETRILLFDEPDAHLDIACVFRVLSLLQELTRLGKTVCLSLHNLQLASQYADHVIVLKDGMKLGEGTPAQIFEPGLIRQVFGVGMSIQIGLHFD